MLASTIVFILLVWGGITAYIILWWTGFIQNKNPDGTTIDRTRVLGIYTGVYMEAQTESPRQRGVAILIMPLSIIFLMFPAWQF